MTTKADDGQQIPDGKSVPEKETDDMDGISKFERTRRNLPHWQTPGSSYFITWDTVKRFILRPAERTIAFDAIRYWDEDRWIVYCAVIMPNHVHLIAQPLRLPGAAEPAVYPLKTLLHSVKSYSAHQINRQRERTGAVWLDERYDRILRDDEEFWQKWQYIRDNPVKSGLARVPEEYPWFYERRSIDSSQPLLPP